MGLLTILRPMLVLALVTGAVFGAEPARVLLIHSFGRDFAPYDAFSGYFRTELARQSPRPIDFYEVALESARFRETLHEGPLVDYLRALFAGRRLDLVVPIGGPAVRFAQQRRASLFPATPMLLAGTDQRHLDPATLTTNDAAVTVRYDLAQMMETVLQVLPQTTNVAVVVGRSAIEQFWLGELRHAFLPFTNRVRFDWFHELPFTTMLERVAVLPPCSAIFFALLAVDADGVPHLEERALTRLHDAANAPIFGLHDVQLGRGIVGGPLMGVEALSQRTARVAVSILAGENPSRIQVPPQEPGPPQFDWRELRRWAISEARLPAGSVLHFRQPTVWELYRGRILAILALCLIEAVLILLLAANLVKRRRAERALRDSEERLSLATGAGDIGVWVWDRTRNQIWATPNWRQMFGFAPDDPIPFESVIQRIHPDDRAIVERAVQRAIEQRTDYAGEYRVMLPDGALRWIGVRGRLDSRAEARLARMLGASVDITERRRAEEAARDLSGRLIRAQEEERARLARELHDDITQRLARLAIDVGRCEQGTSEQPLAETMRAVRAGLVRLSEDVHALSYRLHPSVLEDLGLVEALKAEGERLARQESLRVNLQLREVPKPVPHDAALCLFRVAQEALRNVARHAQARTVEVSLRSLDGGLQLAVQDDGRGFDPAVQRPRPSLGLASMRERVHLLGGELDIDTVPGRGTTIVAWVPGGEGKAEG